MSDTHRVHVSEIRLTDFRNYGSLSLPLDSRHVVLTGENGAGKTNLLEAVSLLSPGRGLRRATYAEMCRADAADGFTVFARVNGMDGEVAIGTAAGGGEPGSRVVRINGTKTGSADEMLDHLRLVWLTPAMDGLFTGPKNDRRRFLDRQVLAIDPAHGRRTLDYERAMRSRNRLLAEGRFDPAWLDGIERQMAELGVAIALARREMVTLLISLIDSSQLDSPFPRAALAIDDFLSGSGGAAAELEETFAENLARFRHRDAAAGRTLEGPHRSDLLVHHSGKDMEAARCSTGEQKALLIGLVLAHARLTAQTCGFAPLMLLDEIAAHLDEGRRAALFDLIESLGGQTFMTGTDRDMFAALGERARHFTVSSGTVHDISG